MESRGDEPGLLAVTKGTIGSRPQLVSDVLYNHLFLARLKGEAFACRLASWWPAAATALTFAKFTRPFLAPGTAVVEVWWVLAVVYFPGTCREKAMLEKELWKSSPVLAHFPKVIDEVPVATHK
jgi:hypothetical protein